MALAAGQPAVIRGEAPRSTLWAPLIARDEAIGVMSIQNLDREVIALRDGIKSDLDHLVARLEADLAASAPVDPQSWPDRSRAQRALEQLVAGLGGRNM
mgnify:CR=1 FL=1